MAKNKKPSKKYNPRKILGMKNLPSLESTRAVFAPLYTAFENLEAGEIEVSRGKPIFKDLHGEWCELAPAMHGWADCWERVGKDQGISFDFKPLRKLAQKLDYGIPVTAEEVAAAKAVINHTRKAFMSLPVEITRHHALVEQVQIQVDRLGLKEKSS